VAVYNFVPDERDTPGLGGFLGHLAGLVTDPVMEIIGLATDSAQKSGSNNGIFPVTVDTTTGKVTVTPRQGVEKGRGVLLNRMAREYASATEAFLQQVYDSGQVSKVPGQQAYAPIARDIAKLKPEEPLSPEEPETITLPRSDTGQNFMGGFVPPGGMAGFSQMSAASQLALTRGGRKSSGGRKRRTKRAKVRKTRKTRTKRAKKGKAKRFVKGSAAAKRYMAKIRRKRK
jgi:hypothetical protein